MNYLFQMMQHLCLYYGSLIWGSKATFRVYQLVKWKDLIMTKDKFRGFYVDARETYKLENSVLSVHAMSIPDVKYIQMSYDMNTITQVVWTTQGLLRFKSDDLFRQL